MRKVGKGHTILQPLPQFMSCRTFLEVADYLSTHDIHHLLPMIFPFTDLTVQSIAAVTLDEPSDQGNLRWRGIRLQGLNRYNACNNDAIFCSTLRLDPVAPTFEVTRNLLRYLGMSESVIAEAIRMNDKYSGSILFEVPNGRWQVGWGQSGKLVCRLPVLFRS